MADQAKGPVKESRAGSKRTDGGAPDPAALLIRIRELEGEALAIRADERGRLQQELHNGLSQHLGGVVLLAKILSNTLTAANRPEAEQARELTDLLSAAVAQTRALMDQLAPSR